MGSCDKEFMEESEIEGKFLLVNDEVLIWKGRIKNKQIAICKNLL